MRFLVIKKSWIWACLLCCLAAFAGWFVLKQDVIPTLKQGDESPPNKYVINMVTGEFSTKTEDGREIEAYRWDPGTINVPAGEEVTLSIYGVNGKEHPFIIEGTQIKGTVKKGEETLVKVKFEKEGIYRLICLTHPDKEHNGPMIAYIVVD